MNAAKKDQTGVVVTLSDSAVIMLSSEVPRRAAARLIREVRRAHRIVKFFPARASEAAASIRKINNSGIVRRILTSDPSRP